MDKYVTLQDFLLCYYSFVLHFNTCYVTFILESNVMRCYSLTGLIILSVTAALVGWDVTLSFKGYYLMLKLTSLCLVPLIVFFLKRIHE